MNKRLAIVGSGGHGKVVADVALSAGWQEIDFYDDAWPEISTLSRWPVVGDSAALMKDLDRVDAVFVAIGNNRIRQRLLKQFIELGAEPATLIHPAATVSVFAEVGVGTVVMAGAVINVDSSIGLGGIVNTGANVDHDVVAGECVHICPGVSIAGEVTIGELAWVGIGSSVRQCLSIGSGALIGAGSAVVCSVPEGVTWAGVPAKPLTRSPSC